MFTAYLVDNYQNLQYVLMDIFYFVICHLLVIFAAKVRRNGNITKVNAKKMPKGISI